MSEQEEDPKTVEKITEETVEKKPAISVKEKLKLKRFAITIIIIIIFVPIFGKLIPKLFFGMEPEKAVEKIEIPIEEQIKKPIPTSSNTLLVPLDSAVIPQNQETSSSPVVTSPETEITPKPSPEKTKNSNSLEDKIISLEAAHKAKISELKSKFEAQSLNAKIKADNMLLGLVAFEQLKEVINDGKAYSEQLDKLKKITEKDHEASEVQDIIAKLLPESESGIVIQTKLNKKFNQLATQALDSANSGWFKSFANKFITIRKVGQQNGSDDESVLARAEVELKKGNLKLALKELKQLSPPAKEVFNKWSTQANDWFEMRINLDKLQLLLTKTKYYKTQNMFQL